MDDRLSLDSWRQRIFDELIAAHCDKWQPLLHLDHWRVAFKMASVIGDDPTVEAHCMVQTADGHRATVTFSDVLVEREDAGWCEETVVHELVHIILDELAQYAFHNMPEEAHPWFTRLVETAVADLCRILLDLDKRAEGES